MGLVGWQVEKVLEIGRIGNWVIGVVWIIWCGRVILWSWVVLWSWVIGRLV